MIENIQAVIFAVLEFIRYELKVRIGRFLERAKQTFEDRPYSSFSARQQGRMAERWLAENQAVLEEGLHRRMMEAFTGVAAKKEINYDELQLLDDDSLNVVMLRAHIVSSVMERARESVVTLEVRLEAMKRDGFNIDSRAFTPGAIADGFVETLKALSVPIEVQILLMEAYSDQGVDMLEQFYKDLNELLSSKGVMPGFKYSIVKSVSKERPAPPAGTQLVTVAWPGGGGAAGAGAGPGGIGGGPPGAAPAGGTGGKEAIPAWPTVASGAMLPAEFAQLLDAKLNAMQAALAHLTGETWEPGTLRDTFKIPPPISLSPEQEESIDHIEAVFLDLIRDTRISSRFRSELNRLILPLMSLRLSDADLFKNPDNPVRRFIRQLALLGFRDNETPIQEFEHIGLIVGRIVSERAQELGSFVTGADALYTIARNEVRAQLEMRHKTAQRAPAAETVPQRVEQGAEALEFVREMLRKMSAGLHLPSVVQHFVLRLMAPWMMASYQQHGRDSAQMKECLADSELFFNLLEPSGSPEDHAEKIQRRQRLLEQMAFRAVRARMKEGEMTILLEGIAAYFDTLNGSPYSGLARESSSDDSAFVSYLDDLKITRAE